MIRFLSHLYDLSGELEEQQSKEKEAEEILRTLSKGFGVQQRLLRAMLLRKKVQDQMIHMLRSRFIEKQKSILEPYGFTELDELDNDMNENENENGSGSGNESIHLNETIDSTEPKKIDVSSSMNKTPELAQPESSHNKTSSLHRGLLDQLPSLESIRSSLHESEATATIKFAEYQSACQAIQEFHSQIDSVADEISLLKRQLFASKQSKPDETPEVAKRNRSNVVAAGTDRAIHRLGTEPFGDALRAIAGQRGGDPGDLHAVLCLGSFLADDAAKTDFAGGAFGGSSAFPL